MNGKPGGPAAAKEPEPQTLGARMKRLSREYGWTAVGVYAALSALDFPFCYALVSVLGTDRIGKFGIFLYEPYESLTAMQVYGGRRLSNEERWRVTTNGEQDVGKT